MPLLPLQHAKTQIQEGLFPQGAKDHRIGRRLFLLERGTRIRQEPVVRRSAVEIVACFVTGRSSDSAEIAESENSDSEDNNSVRSEKSDSGARFVPS